MIENINCYSDRPAQYEKAPFNDQLVNAKLNLWPGRQAVFVSMLVSLADQRKLLTTNLPLTFQLFMFEQDCYEREDPSYFLVRTGKFNKLEKNEDQR